MLRADVVARSVVDMQYDRPPVGRFSETRPLQLYVLSGHGLPSPKAAMLRADVVARSVADMQYYRPPVGWFSETRLL